MNGIATAFGANSELSEAVRCVLSDLTRSANITLETVDQQCAKTPSLRDSSSSTERYATMAIEGTGSIAASFNDIADHANSFRGNGRFVRGSAEHLRDEFRRLAGQLRAG